MPGGIDYPEVNPKLVSILLVGVNPLSYVNATHVVSQIMKHAVDVALSIRAVLLPFLLCVCLPYVQGPSF